jgi:hypothetical protein
MPTDPIHDKPLYPSENAYGIPQLRYTPLKYVPKRLLPYRSRLRAEDDLMDAAVHFFLFDAIFESVWNCPQKSQRSLKRFQTVLSPDFSLNAEMPLAVQMFNVYRNRWCGRHWQEHGYQVIPSVGWSTPESYAFCFLGLAEHMPIALTTLGTRRQKAVFLHGFAALIERVKPAVVLCYGQPFAEMERVSLVVYPSRYEQMKG